MLNWALAADLSWPYSKCYSPRVFTRGRTLVSGGDETFNLRIWNVHTGAELNVVPVYRSGIGSFLLRWSVLDTLLIAVSPVSSAQRLRIDLFLREWGEVIVNCMGASAGKDLFAGLG